MATTCVSAAPIRVLILALLVCLPLSRAPAATQWPAFQAGLTPGPSSSPRKARLPGDVEIAPPRADLPRPLAALSGHWRGWMCRNAAVDVALAVEAVSTATARLVFAAASARAAPFSERLVGAIVGGEIVATLRDGSRLTVARRADGHLNVRRAEVGSAERWCTGILARPELMPTPQFEMLKTALIENGAPVRLQTVIFEPAGRGPFPLFVLNHGSTGRGTDPALFRRTWTVAPVAREFLRRGWMVALPYRRGRGKSDGLYDEGFRVERSKGYACDPARSLPGADRALGDIAAAMDVLMADPRVDPRRIVMGGISRGGILSIAYAGKHPDQVRGVVNFVGGWLGTGCGTAETINGALFRRGGSFPRPTLWLYGDSDRYFDLAHSRRNFRAFQDAGGKGTFRAFTPPPAANGHALWRWPDLWRDALDAYLRSLS